MADTTITHPRVFALWGEKTLNEGMTGRHPWTGFKRDGGRKSLSIPVISYHMGDRLLLNQALGTRIMSFFQPKISLHPKRTELPKGSYTERPPSSMSRRFRFNPSGWAELCLPGGCPGSLVWWDVLFPPSPQGSENVPRCPAVPGKVQRRVGEEGGPKAEVRICLTRLNFLLLPPPATGPRPPPPTHSDGPTQWRHDCGQKFSAWEHWMFMACWEYNDPGFLLWIMAADQGQAFMPPPSL